MPAGFLLPVAIPESHNSSVIHHLSWAKLPINRGSKIRQQGWSGLLQRESNITAAYPPSTGNSKGPPNFLRGTQNRTCHAWSQTTRVRDQAKGELKGRETGLRILRRRTPKHEIHSSESILGKRQKTEENKSTPRNLPFSKHKKSQTATPQSSVHPRI